MSTHAPSEKTRHRLLLSPTAHAHDIRALHAAGNPYR